MCMEYRIMGCFILGIAGERKQFIQKGDHNEK